MKSLRDIDNNLLKTDEEKAEGLVRDHCVWNKEERKVNEEKKRIVDEEVEREVLEEMVMKVKTVLNATQTSSAPVPDGTSYRFIKTIKNTILEEKLVEEVAKNLI